MASRRLARRSCLDPALEACRFPAPRLARRRWQPIVIGIDQRHTLAANNLLAGAPPTGLAGTSHRTAGGRTGHGPASAGTSHTRSATAADQVAARAKPRPRAGAVPSHGPPSGMVSPARCAADRLTPTNAPSPPPRTPTPSPSGTPYGASDAPWFTSLLRAAPPGESRWSLGELRWRQGAETQPNSL